VVTVQVPDRGRGRGRGEVGEEECWCCHGWSTDERLDGWSGTSRGCRAKTKQR
jgi:hypothetical protein